MAIKKGDTSKGDVNIVAEIQLKEAYSVLKAEITPKIDEFNDGETSSKWINLRHRVENSMNIENVSLEKAISSLGISDLVGQLHKSEFYALLIKHIKSIEYCTLGKPLYMKDMNNSSIIAHIESKGVDSVLSLVVYRTDSAGTLFTQYSISIMKEEGNKIRLVDFSEIMERIKSIEEVR